jgi:hypothetical protein
MARTLSQVELGHQKKYIYLYQVVELRKRQMSFNIPSVEILYSDGYPILVRRFRVATSDHAT